MYLNPPEALMRDERDWAPSGGSAQSISSLAASFWIRPWYVSKEHNIIMLCSICL